MLFADKYRDDLFSVYHHLPPSTYTARSSPTTPLPSLSSTSARPMRFSALHFSATSRPNAGKSGFVSRTAKATKSTTPSTPSPREPRAEINPKCTRSGTSFGLRRRRPSQSQSPSESYRCPHAQLPSSHIPRQIPGHLARFRIHHPPGRATTPRSRT